MDKTTDIDEVPFSRLQIGPDDQKEEPLEVTELLVLPPSTSETPEDPTKNMNDKGLTEVEERLQMEEKKFENYRRIYMGQLSDKEDSNTDMEESAYTYFG